jgi:hypothetical protein
LNNTLLSDQWVIDEIKKEIKRVLEVNENENITYQNLRDTARAALRGMFIAMTAYIKRSERSQINDLMLHLKLQENKKIKTHNKQKREIIKIKNETIQRINKTKSWFFEKINKINRSLANLTKTRREKTQTLKTRNAKGEITTNAMEIQVIVIDYFETYIPINEKILKKWTNF